MGSRARSSLFVLSSLLLAANLHAQVFVVGEKAAEADVITEFHPTHVELPTEPLSEMGHMDLIRNLESEQGFAHREIPLGTGLTLVANGNMSPRGDEYKELLYKKGRAAQAGDRVAITRLDFKPDRILIDLNGGPYAKNRILSHISLNDMPLASEGPAAIGTRIVLVFEGGVPDVTAAEVKALLDPLIDFKARSSAEAYTNTLLPVVRDAVESHRVLVGMDQRMVLAALGAPRSKDREHTVSTNADSPMYEEWIYGEPPQATQFVRFHNGRVIRLEIAAIGKPIEVHDKNEIGPEQPEPTLRTRTIANGDPDPDAVREGRQGTPPTLRRPGDPIDQTSTSSMGKVRIPADTTTTGSPVPSASPKQLTQTSGS